MESGALEDTSWAASGRTRPVTRSGTPVRLPWELAPRPAQRTDWQVGYRLTLAGTDAVVIVLALVVAQAVRFGVTPLEAHDAAGVYSQYSLAIGVLWLGSLTAIRSRTTRHAGAGNTEYQRVANGTFITFGLVAVIALLAKIDVARGYLLVALPTGLLGLLMGRYLWRAWLSGRRRAGECLTGAFVVGDRQDVIRTVGQLLRHHHAGYKPVAVAFSSGTGGARHVAVDGTTVPLLDYETVANATRATGTRAVIVAGELPGGRPAIQDLGWQLENSRTELILVSQLTDVAGPRIHMRPVEGLPMLHVDLPQYAGFNHTAKRGIDLTLTMLALLLLSPILVLVAIAVRLDSAGPVLFRQQRIGAHGEPFTMFKFRSMIVDAEARLAELARTNEGSGLLFKMKDDPRITRTGRFLRRYSLDELPQLLNVLNGSMSLIGPRPPLPGEVAAYEGRVNRRLLIKPGITGLWQVSGRSNLSWEESVKLDLYYVENWSVTTDFIILLKTVRAVLRRDGAY